MDPLAAMQERSRQNAGAPHDDAAHIQRLDQKENSMRSPLARLGGVAVGLLALLGGLTPPAHATTILAAAFVGTATLTGPLGYPCVGPGGALSTGTLDTALCPTTKFNLTPNANFLTLPGSTATTASHLTNPTNLNRTILHLITAGVILTNPPLTLPAPFNVIPQHHPQLHHNTVGVQLVAPILNLCVPLGLNINKPGKPLTHAGLCNFGAIVTPTLPNTVSGNCGLSTGQVTVTFTDALGQAFTLDTHFVAVGGFLFIEGHAKKVGSTQTGLVVGFVVAIPPVPGTSTQSCTNKTATTFTLVGVVGAAG
jgi:hypothetical protein